MPVGFQYGWSTTDSADLCLEIPNFISISDFPPLLERIKIFQLPALREEFERVHWERNVCRLSGRDWAQAFKKALATAGSYSSFTRSGLANERAAYVYNRLFCPVHKVGREVGEGVLR